MEKTHRVEMRVWAAGIIVLQVVIIGAVLAALVQIADLARMEAVTSDMVSKNGMILMESDTRARENMKNLHLWLEAIHNKR